MALSIDSRHFGCEFTFVAKTDSHVNSATVNQYLLLFLTVEGDGELDASGDPEASWFAVLKCM